VTGGEEKVGVVDWRVGEWEVVHSEAFSSFDEAQSGKLLRSKRGTA